MSPVMTMWLYTYMHTYMHVCVHAHTHTYTHTHTQRWLLLSVHASITFWTYILWASQ